MNIELLYPMVSEAIRRAETLEELGAPGASDAFQDVSLLEEKIAQQLPSSHPEGAVARRGAIRAALQAADFERAQRLIEGYLQEEETEPELVAQLNDFQRQVEAAEGSVVQMGEETFVVYLRDLSKTFEGLYCKAEALAATHDESCKPRLLQLQGETERLLRAKSREMARRRRWQQP